jgi:hypothetical protein
MSGGITEQPSGSRPGAIELRYDLRVDDLIALTLALFDRGGTFKPGLLPTQRLVRLAGAVMVACLVGLGVAGHWPGLDPYRPAFMAVGYLAALAVGYLFLDVGGGLRRLDRRYVERHARSVQAKRVALGDLRPRQHVVARFDAAGFTEVTTWQGDKPGIRQEERAETVVPWWRVDQVLWTGEHAVLRVGTAGYLIVPRDAFADDSARQDFLDAVGAWRRAAAAVRPADTRITA